MALRPEKKIIGIVVLFGTLIALIGVAVIWPTIHYIKTLSGETQDLKKYLEERYERSRHQRLSSKKIVEIKEKSGDLEQFLFKTGDELLFITELEQIAAAAAVTQKIDSTNLDSALADRLTLGIVATGRFENILNYLNSIERLERFITVETATLSAGDIDTASNEVKAATLRLTISIYVAH